MKKPDLQKHPQLSENGNVSDPGDEKERVAEGVTPWDVLAYIGQAYDRLKQIRTTLYQIRNKLLGVPHDQAQFLFDILLRSLPMTVYSVAEALEVLAKLDTDLLPRSQVHRKTLSKWEMYRDDSAHFALRAFFVATNRHELKRFWNGELCGDATFVYDFDVDQFCAGENQRISVIDALDAIRASYKDVERRLSREPEKYPPGSMMDADISRTIRFYDELMDEDIDSFNEYDYLFHENLERRSTAVLNMLKDGPKSEEQIYAATDVPRSITKQVLSIMSRDDLIQATRTEAGWLFNRASSNANP